MYRLIRSLLPCILWFAMHWNAWAITIPTVLVGNPGNLNDPMTGHGGVANVYRIGTTEVNVGQYTAFLNAVADTDTYELYNPSMAADLNIAGIARTGASGSYSYSVIGSPNKPVTYVSWGDAARFSNWLHNGQPTGPQGSGTTETGAYTLNGATSSEAYFATVRTPEAKWSIPSENEWYKAAYHQPVAQGGDADNYWTYPTRTNSIPYSDQPPGALAIQNNVANYFNNDSVANGYNDGFAVTGSTAQIANQNYLTDGGAYTSAASFYGTFDQGGNVFEWNDAFESGLYRAIRGGYWRYDYTYMQSSNQLGGEPNYESFDTGFRVFGIASVPEPSTLALAALGALGLLIAARCKR